MTSCGGDDDTTGGTAGKAGSGGGSGGSTATGGSGGGGTAGTGGTGGSKDAGTDVRIPCGETSCNPAGANRLCNPNAPGGPRCQTCLVDGDCSMNTQMRLFCEVNATNASACRSCVTDAHCTAPQRCIPGNNNNNTCQTRCASDADCATQMTNRACNVTTMMCVECQTNAHCVGNADGPVCVGTSCQECGMDTDCINPAMPACVGNNCVACRDNTQCAEPTPNCVTTGANANTCRECANNTQCTGRPGGGACVTNVCRQCNGAVPCPPGNTCTMNVCVPVPEAGPPEAGREGGSDASEGGADTGSDTATDAPNLDGAADVSGG